MSLVPVISRAAAKGKKGAATKSAPKKKASAAFIAAGAEYRFKSTDSGSKTKGASKAKVRVPATKNPGPVKSAPTKRK